MMDMVEMFRKLAQIDSVSGEESTFAKNIVDYLQEEGINVRMDEKGMLYAKLDGGVNKPLLFCAHMDTVEPGRGVRVKEQGGYLVSEGETILGGDNKASLAAMLVSMVHLKELGVKRNIELLLTVREETDSGIKDIVKEWIQSKRCFVFDGGGGNMSWLVSRAPSIADFTIYFNGKSAHASRPEEGVDALRMLGDSKVLNYLGRWGKKTTFNCGIIGGGVATNSIMPQLRIEGDIRGSDDGEYESLRQIIERGLNRTGKRFSSEVGVEWKEYSRGYCLDMESEGVERLRKIYKSMGMDVEGGETVSASDAGFLNSIGIETFCLGDGVEKAHTKEERIEIKKLIQLGEIVEELMKLY